MADANWVREYQDGEVVPGTAYRVIRLLGTGGMGSVYEVEHVELGRRYVLKSLLSTLASREDLILRMRNEWKALGDLRHPNIVDVVYAGNTADGIPYYVMELLLGETVRERLEREGKICAGHAARIAQQTLLGLAAAHAIGVVHRDIKPANVFLSRDGTVKVLDFGIAYTGGVRKITAQGLAIGTPRYMSPEQASGEKADARSDLYAVGLLMFEMLAGEGPFDDLSEVTQQMLAHLHRPPRPLSRFTQIPPKLETVVTRALEKNPQERARSAEYMAAELAPFATPLPALAPGIAPIPQTGPAVVQLSTEWQRPTRELRPSRPTPTAVVSTATTSPFVTRGAAIGVATAAVLIGSAIFVGFSRSESPATATATTTTTATATATTTTTTTTTTTATATATTTTTATATTTTTTTATATTTTTTTATATATALDLHLGADSSSATVVSAKPTISARKPPTRGDAPESEPIRLPPSGL